VSAALDQLFANPQTTQPCTAALAGGALGIGGATPTTTTTPPTTTTPGAATTTPPTGASVQALLDQAAAKLDQAQTALANQDLGTYQRLVNEARTLIKQAQSASGK
jgi:hypothetical protein